MSGSSKRWAYRVQSIPNSVQSTVAAKKFLKQLFSTNNISTDFAIRTLSPSLNTDRHKTAIVTFDVVDPASPIKLFNPTSATWKISLPPLEEDAVQQGSEIEDETPDSVSIDDKFLGFTVLSAPKPEHHKQDIVIIHGLGNGHAYGSFKERGSEHMWLLDNLKKDCPSARILTYGYDSKLEESNSFQTLEDLTIAFVRSLQVVREQDISAALTPKPIIFLAHSLGGLILKQAMIHMNRRGAPPPYHDTRLATSGIIFFAVPHQGLDTSFVRAIVHNQANEDLINEMRPNSPLLLDMRRDFNDAFPFRDSTIVYVYETKKSPTAQKNAFGKWEMNGPAVVLVDKDSATAGRYWENEPHHILSVNTNHSDIVKFGDNDEDYVRVRSQLRRILSESEGIIRGRFQRVMVSPLINFTWHSDSEIAESTTYISDAVSPTSSDTQGQTSFLNYVVDHLDNKSMNRDKTYSPGPKFASTLHHRICFPWNLWLWSNHLSTNARIIIVICVITAIVLGILAIPNHRATYESYFHFVLPSFAIPKFSSQYNFQLVIHMHNPLHLKPSMYNSIYTTIHNRFILVFLISPVNLGLNFFLSLPVYICFLAVLFFYHTIRKPGFFSVFSPCYHAHNLHHQQQHNHHDVTTDHFLHFLQYACMGRMARSAVL
ncbi:hypothetical protein MMC17_008670 [Xylographa soralifera]|nr:hypothetical protein [Xylographa soralifera]